MWTTACLACGWTSGDRVLKDAAVALKEMHIQDNAGHIVVIDQGSSVCMPSRPAKDTIKG
jgi:hypothetical protein